MVILSDKEYEALKELYKSIGRAEVVIEQAHESMRLGREAIERSKRDSYWPNPMED